MKTRNRQFNFLRPRVSIYLTLAFALGISAYANTITVINTNDSGPGSLRQALADANDHDTIEFAVSGTIALTSGELLVDKRVIISGPGDTNLVVNGNTSRAPSPPRVIT
jgi:hypothetical protein